MARVTISPEIWLHYSGIYKISFSDGHFYIGGSKQLKTRIKTHLGAINSGFSSPSTCKTLRKMKGFEGEIEILLLEAIELDHYPTFGMGSVVSERELYHLKQHKDNPLLLNNPRTMGTKTFVVSTMIEKELYNTLVAISTEKNEPLAATIENLILKGLSK